MKKLLFLCCLLFTLKGTSQNLPRLLSQVDTILNVNQFLYDTMHFYYTGNRMDFDSCITYYANNAFNGTSYFGEDQTFDANGNILTYITRNNFGNGWYNDRRLVYTYDVYNKKTVWMEQEYYLGGWQNYTRDSFIYDNNNNVAMHFFSLWHGTAGAYVDHQVDIYTYDANHNVLTSLNVTFNFSTMTWDSTNRFTYTYNADNKQLTKSYESYLTGSWQQTYFDSNVYNNDKLILHINSNIRDSCIYDANDDLVKVLHSTNGASVQYYNLDSNVYDNAHNEILSVQKAYVSGFHWEWVDVGRTSTTYNNYHQPTLRIIEKRSGFVLHWDSSGRYYATYNSHQQPTLEVNEVWSDSAHGWVPSLMDQYFKRRHYENDDLSVKNNEVQSLSIKLYPNPASSFLTIDMSVSAPEKTQIAIYSITGALMMQWSEDATTNLHRMIPVSSFSAGNYVFQVKGKENQQSQLFTIAR